MKRLDTLRTSNVAMWGVIKALLTLALASSCMLRAQSVGPGGVPGKNSGGAVSSVFGRTGAVAAASGDYTAAQVTNAAATNATNTFTAPQSITGSSAALNLQSTGGDLWAISAGGTSFGGMSLYLYNNTTSAITASWNGLTYELQAAGAYAWNSSSNPTGAADTALTRPTAKTIAVGNGSEGDASGTIEAANLILGGAPIEQAATAPTGSCSTLEWVLSNDGHLSYCSGSGGTWTEKF